MPFSNPIEAIVGSVPNDEAARSGNSQLCSAISPTPEENCAIASSNCAAKAESPVCIDCSARSAVRAGHRWPVPLPLGAHGLPVTLSSPYPSPLYRCHPGPLSVSLLMVASTTFNELVKSGSSAANMPNLDSSRKPASITSRWSSVGPPLPTL